MSAFDDAIDWSVFLPVKVKKETITVEQMCETWRRVLAEEAEPDYFAINQEFSSGK